MPYRTFYPVKLHLSRAQPNLKRFFELAFSAIIITKSGGVSLARDLAHTRPHRAKVIYSQTGEIIEGEKFLEYPHRNLEHSTKVLRSAIEEFDKRIQNCGQKTPGKPHYSNRLLGQPTSEQPMCS
jgi:hypothetical protein